MESEVQSFVREILGAIRQSLLSRVNKVSLARSRSLNFLEGTFHVADRTRHLIATMAVPATKKRKTEHVSSDDDSEASFASFGEDGDQTKEADGGALEDDEEMGDGELGESEDEEDGHSTEKDTATAKPATVSKPALQQNGNKPSRAAQTSAAYASGTFKSNVFKLQVDELLGQIRPRQGKRQTAAETALHALKKSIEQIPARAHQAESRCALPRPSTAERCKIQVRIRQAGQHQRRGQLPTEDDEQDSGCS